MTTSTLKSPGLFFNILVDLNDAVDLMVSIRPPISNSSRTLSQPLGTVQIEPNTSGITAPLCFTAFLVLWQSPKLVSLLTFFDYHFVVRQDVKLNSTPSSLYLLIITRSGLYVSQNPSEFYVSQDRFWFVHLVGWSNYIVLHNSKWILFLTLLCLVLYSFCASLLHSLIIWIMDYYYYYYFSFFL